jgi:beta-glucosidase
VDSPAGGQARFVWATGLEDTFVVQEAPGRRRMDELELVGHYEAWQEDVETAAALGFGAMRCGIPWYRVEPSPGQFDWSWTDQLLPHMVACDIEPIVDLVHYGTPTWMPWAFADPSYSPRVTAFAAAFAERYDAIVRYYTPVNEPAVTALVCGFAGRWPPGLSGHRGYVRVLDSLCRGIVGQIGAIRRARPDAVIVHVEGTGFWLDADAPADATGSAVPERIYAALDLLSGRVDAAHEQYPYLRRHGMTERDLAWYRAHASMPDLIGLNYYPDGSVHRRSSGADGDPDAITTVWGGTAHLERAIFDFQERYGLPIFVSETGCNERSASWVKWPGAGQAPEDGSQFRSWWLAELDAMLRRLAGGGGPRLWGCTWWPLVDAVDWAYREGDEPLATYLEPGGLVRLVPTSDGRLAREPMAVGDRVREVIRGWT